ncbi:hypothetical protein BV22DRAFT_1135596 [Leucogyrophana mollusca]|uniref:Uncharacterized protein n=1 Tax=Leucogyrophana mollusca TaxID=85980 RepID=A0ACB8AW68_9AGAM|nr:hypothetical protein BV22DRAFT_1135596 [Leucogyrophana mollusca]
MRGGRALSRSRFSQEILFGTNLPAVARSIADIYPGKNIQRNAMESSRRKRPVSYLRSAHRRSRSAHDPRRRIPASLATDKANLLNSVLSLRATGDPGYAVPDITNSPGKDADGDDIMLSAMCQSQFTQSLLLFARQSRFEPHVLPPALPMLLHLPQTLANVLPQVPQRLRPSPPIIVYVYDLPANDAISLGISFADFCIDQAPAGAYAAHLAEAIQAHANLHGVLKESKRTDRDDKDHLRLSKVLDEYLPQLYGVMGCDATGEIARRSEPSACALCPGLGVA